MHSAGAIIVAVYTIVVTVRMYVCNSGAYAWPLVALFQNGNSTNHQLAIAAYINLASYQYPQYGNTMYTCTYNRIQYVGGVSDKAGAIVTLSRDV